MAENASTGASEGRADARIIEDFSPAWFAVVMGTAVVPLAVSFLSQEFSRQVAAVFTVISLLVFVSVLVPWTIRIIKYPDAVKRDLKHPVAGSFFPTMPIALILLALDLLKYPDLFFSTEASREIAWVLWLAGSIGIYVSGFVVLPSVYRNKGVDLSHASFGWYIPPVSKLLIPVAGFELAALYPQRFEIAFGLSLISLGVGFFLFLFVGSLVYQRYVLEALPAGRLAATSFIAITPTAIIAVIFFKLMHLVELNQVLGIDAEVISSLSVLVIIASWGFSVWAFTMAVVVVASYALHSNLPYALSWWAFTFPSGALAVASGVAWRVTGFGFIHSFYIFSVAFLLLVITFVAVRTVRGVISRKVFIPSH